MRRRPLKLLTRLSLVLCVAVVLLRLRTRFVSDEFVVVRQEGGQDVARFVFSDHGVIGYGWLTQQPSRRSLVSEVDYRTSQPDWFRYSQVTPDVQELVELHSPPGTPPSAVHYTFPYLPVAFLAALTSAFSAWQLRLARRRELAGFCGSCGYDLRATPGRCPECGSPGTIA